MSGKEFRIEIAPGKASYFYGERDGDPIVERTGIDLQIDELRLATARLLENWLNAWGRIASATDVSRVVLRSETFKIMGSYLWLLILDNEIGAKLKEVMAELEDPPLQVQISFDNHTSNDLRSLPWEFLCVPDTEDFLATSTKMLLVRYTRLRGEPGRTVARANDRLSVQFITALPKSFKYDKLNERTKTLQASLVTQARIDERELIEEFDAAKIEQALNRDAPPCHVVHITGLCRGDPGRPQLWQAPSDGNGPEGWSDAVPLVDALTANSDGLPRLVVLQLIEYSEGDADENFERLAPELIARGIPAVLAMQYTLPPTGAESFWIKFYKDLSDGRMSVGRAVQESRHMLQGRRPNRDMGTPVLYLREDEPLVEKSRTEAQSSDPRGRIAPQDDAAHSSVQQALRAAMGRAEPFYSQQTLARTRAWLAELKPDCDVDEARVELRRFLVKNESFKGIVDLCAELGKALKPLDRGGSHG